jgi:hypothetical protein
MKKKYTLFVALCVSLVASAQTKILFDATKAEMAGSADWVIDADAHNIYSGNGPMSIGGTESNPQKIPTLAQSGITAATAETYWDGALSHWAVDCVNQGYTVETLPYNGQITYGLTSNAQDLSHYKVYVVDEPNIAFTAGEKNAIVNFVKNGGGLLMIADHTISDRNNDGVDSPMVWNDLMANNSIAANPFGFAFDQVDISGNSTNIANLPTNTILHGTFGNVTKVLWTNGTTMTLDPTTNSSVKGLIYKTGASLAGTTNVMVASASYLAGKIVAIGDSSIADDGSGDTGDVLYNGYITDAAGNHQKLLMNAMIWLATTSLATTSFDPQAMTLAISPNPIQGKNLHLYYQTTSSTATFMVYDSLGRLVKTTPLASVTETTHETIDCSGLHSGIYFGKLADDKNSKTIKFIISE